MMIFQYESLQTCNRLHINKGSSLIAHDEKIEKAYVSQRYRAGKLGSVRWCISNKNLVKARGKLGLSSSKIHNTDANKAQSLLSSFTLPALLRFIMFWIAGDGTVQYDTYQDKSTKAITTVYQELTFFARDAQIMALLKEALDQKGLPPGYSSVSQITGNRLNVLHLKKRTILNDAILEALADLPEAILHPNWSCSADSLPRQSIEFHQQSCIHEFRFTSTSRIALMTNFSASLSSKLH